MSSSFVHQFFIMKSFHERFFFQTSMFKHIFEQKTATENTGQFEPHASPPSSPSPVPPPRLLLVEWCCFLHLAPLGGVAIPRKEGCPIKEGGESSTAWKEKEREISSAQRRRRRDHFTLLFFFVLLKLFSLDLTSLI